MTGNKVGARVAEIGGVRVTVRQVELIAAVLAHEVVFGERGVTASRVAELLRVRTEVIRLRADRLVRYGLLRMRLSRGWPNLLVIEATDVARRATEAE